MNDILLVIDMQKGFITDHSRHVITRIQTLLNQKIFEYVIFTKFINTIDSPFQRVMNWYRLQEPSETDIVDELLPYANEIVEKNIFSAFTVALEQRLHTINAKNLYLVGLDTEACVLKTTLDAFEKGFIPYVLSYYCASSEGSDYHEAGLKVIVQCIGRKQIIKDKHVILL